MKEYASTLLLKTLYYCIFPALILFYTEPNFIVWFITFLVMAIFASYGVYDSAITDKDKIHNREVVDIKEKARVEIVDTKEKAQTEISEATRKLKKAEISEQLWKQTLLERNSGFKTLLAYISEFERLRDEPTSNYLKYKDHPALKASEVVKEEMQRRRRAEMQNKITQALIEMYEQYAPFLVDLKDDIPEISDISSLHEYSEEEKLDTVIHYLTKEEYRQLPTAERNQLALDRFWSRPKSKWLIGKLYERYIGFLYEQKGYTVEYFGITEKYEDMGRDLICHKGNETLIVQCKNWAQFKTIYEKHIFQLFGTTFEYRDKHPTRDIKAVFYTTTQISEIARKIGEALGIELFEHYKFDKNYPCIKCNISTLTQEKIYHLPFDQRYDDTKIDRKGEKYCISVADAEESGFRRAFRWHDASVEHSS